MFFAESDWHGKVILLKFDGAAHEATVYLNGKELATHKCGYTAFTVDLTSEIKYGEDNEIIVKLDSRESLNIPPFGFVVDYLTYGGLYREVTLQLREHGYVKERKN